MSFKIHNQNYSASKKILKLTTIGETDTYKWGSRDMESYIKLMHRNHNVLLSGKHRDVTPRPQYSSFDKNFNIGETSFEGETITLKVTRDVALKAFELAMKSGKKSINIEII